MRQLHIAVATQVLFFAILISHSPATLAGVYKCTGADGRISYQAKPCTTNTTQSVVKLRSRPATATAARSKAAAGSASAAQKPTAEIVLYSTAWCGYCKKVRNLFATNGIAYKELDIEKSASAKRAYDKLNGKGVPLTSINGTVVRGYQEKRLLSLAKAKS